MIDLLAEQKKYILYHLGNGDVAADFTMGNGHDTEFLVNTKKRLVENGCPENYELILDSHSNADKYIKSKIKAGVFNLGYLPGSGQKELTTKRETTLKAINIAIDLMDKDAIILIAVYPGHEEGEIEGRLIKEMLSKLDRRCYCVTEIMILNSPTSPYFILVENK